MITFGILLPSTLKLNVFYIHFRTVGSYMDASLNNLYNASLRRFKYETVLPNIVILNML